MHFRLTNTCHVSPETRGVLLRALQLTQGAATPLSTLCPSAAGCWGQWHVPAARGQVAWWPSPCIAVPSPHGISCWGDTAPCPAAQAAGDQKLHVCLRGLLPLLCFSSSYRDPLEPCSKPGLKSCMGFIVTWTMSSAGSFLEQNLLFQLQKLKIKYITTLAFSLRRVHCAPDCARCKHCHSPKKGTGQEIRKGRCQFDWAQRCSAAWLHAVRPDSMSDVWQGPTETPAAPTPSASHAPLTPAARVPQLQFY